MKSIPVIFVATVCSIALLLKIGGGQQEIEKYLPQGQGTELDIECVSAVISKPGNEAADYLVTLKLYIDPEFYTYVSLDNNVPNIKLDGDGDRFDVQPFKCNSEPTEVDSLFGKFDSYSGLLEYCAVIKFNQEIDESEPFLGTVVTQVSNVHENRVVTKRFAAFFENE